MMEDQKLRQWAIEQAIATHGAQGRTMELILGEAEKLLEFVLQAPPRNVELQENKQAAMSAMERVFAAR